MESIVDCVSKSASVWSWARTTGATSFAPHATTVELNGFWYIHVGIFFIERELTVDQVGYRVDKLGDVCCENIILMGSISLVS